MIVVDASAVLEVLLRTPSAAEVEGEMFGATLLTRDARLAAAGGHRARVRLVGR